MHDEYKFDSKFIFKLTSQMTVARLLVEAMITLLHCGILILDKDFTPLPSSRYSIGGYYGIAHPQI